jgi:hypothetical protein
MIHGNKPKAGIRFLTKPNMGIINVWVFRSPCIMFLRIWILGGLLDLYEPSATLYYAVTLRTCDAITCGRIFFTMLTFLTMYLKMLDCVQDSCVSQLLFCRPFLICNDHFGITSTNVTYKT